MRFSTRAVTPLHISLLMAHSNNEITGDGSAAGKSSETVLVVCGRWEDTKIARDAGAQGHALGI